MTSTPDADAATERFALLRRTGEIVLTDATASDLSALRRLAKRDGYRVTTATSRDRHAHGRKRTVINLVDDSGMVQAPNA